jgi:hypothetical protein
MTIVPIARYVFYLRQERWVSQSVGQLVTSGFDNWKKALERFDVHEKAIYHKDAVLKSNNFLNVMTGKLPSIELSLDQTKNSQIQENKEKRRPIIQTVILCGRQGIALRGHRDYGEFDIHNEPQNNEGNFPALLRARIEAGDNILKKHFETCGKNATYISWNIQN